jgi:hypothetical protein
MKLHSEFKALGRTGQLYADLLNRDEVADGAFARVTPIGHEKVLKATICTATNALFEQLLALGVSNQPVPDGLPCVLQKHGNLVKDRDGLIYTVWSIERLFHPHDEVSMRKARIAGKQTLSRLKPGYASRSARLSGTGLTELQEALRQEQDYCKSPDSWEGCAEIALAMSLRTQGQMKLTFLFLLQFIRRRKVSLDLLTQGNVMLNMFGEPCLSDPVCFDETTTQALGLMSGTCVVAEVPFAMDGLRGLRMQPRSSFPLPQDQSSALVREMKAMGLTPRLTQWGKAVHLAFMRKTLEPRSIWSIPHAAKNLKEGRYEKLFTG